MEQRQEQKPCRFLKNGEENPPQRHAVERGARCREEDGMDLQAAERRRHAEGEERREREEREEQIQSAPEKPSGHLAAKRAQQVEYQPQRETQSQRECERERLIGDRHAHPKSRAKKPSPFSGSSA